MDCVAKVLNCALEEGFVGVLARMIVCAILVVGCTTFLRGWKVYFAQHCMCHMLQISVFAVFAVSANDC